MVIKIIFGLIIFALCLSSVVEAQTECSCKVTQDGEMIPPQLEKGLNVYRLKAKTFRIEVSPISCEPTINLLSDLSQIDYLTQTPLIFASGAYYIAGDFKSADILAPMRQENPRTSLDEEIKMATHDIEWARQKYNELCATLGYCPTPARPFSTHWPFRDPVTKGDREYAEFKRFTEFSPLSKAVGRRIYAVIYTQWQSVTRFTQWGGERPVFYLLKPNIVVLDFQPDREKITGKDKVPKFPPWMPDEACFQTTPEIERDCDINVFIDRKLKLLSPECLEQFKSKRHQEDSNDCLKEFVTMSQAAHQEALECHYSHVSLKCKEQLMLYERRHKNVKCLKAMNKILALCGTGQNMNVKCHNDHEAEIEAACTETPK